MSVKVTGDFKALERLMKKMEHAASSSFRADINKQFAEEARTQIALGFEQSRDPYGRPWKPVHRGGKPLLDTGRLRSSLTPTSNAAGFAVSTDVVYAATHQYGAKIKAKKKGRPLRFKVGPRGAGGWRSKYEVTIPKRQFMPEGDIGPIWREAFNKLADLLLAPFRGP